MEPSVIAYESALISLMRRYLDSEVSFDELANWVEGHDLHWSELEVDSRAEKLALAVMHALWDHQYAPSTEDELHARIAEDYLEIVGSRAIP